MIDEMSRKPEQIGSKARLPRRDFGTPEISIMEEISLLREIKDIRDELNILHRVLNDQRDVIDKLAHHLNWHETRHFDDFMRASGLKSREDRIEKLKDDAQRVQDSVCPCLFVQCVSNWTDLAWSSPQHEAGSNLHCWGRVRSIAGAIHIRIHSCDNHIRKGFVHDDICFYSLCIGASFVYSGLICTANKRLSS